ncbi:FecR family protein [Pedobacter rhizosphaerae]|uniref:FecR family protein n=1 Tax=Pedobacter rhizosphaerae TaxID=390241 RepID=A0A1H9N3X7_9SPHI|nr:FecR family protein [Pedobacter rhizosphaerae]SER30541.1 FecR family protein [Pedobacter rhizosphaerae]
MSSKQENIEHLVYKFNQASITPEELDTLIEWYNSRDDQQVTIFTDLYESEEEVKSRIRRGLLSKMASEHKRPKSHITLIRWIAASAAILLIAVITWKVFNDKLHPQMSAKVEKEILPGGNKATLTLANGKTITLSASQEGIVAGEKITYLNGTPVAGSSAADADQAAMLSLNTPRGGTYKLTLPDGTTVWLNAESSIQYPARFATEARTVKVTGEAYFQVAKDYLKNGDRKPFRVVSKDQEIEVLGTHFNVSAYSEQPGTKTTLEEGRVAIKNKSGRVVLSPGEQSITLNGKTSVKAVDVASQTAWRSGKFSFDDKPFEETMNEIARWYNLKIIYLGGIPQEELVGDAFRNQNIHLVLRILDVAQISYDLDVERRQLTIKGKK